MRRTVFRVPFCYGGDMGGYIEPGLPCGDPPRTPPYVCGGGTFWPPTDSLSSFLTYCYNFFYSHSYSRWTSNFVVVSFGTCRVLVWSVCGPCSRARFCRVRARLWLRCRARRVRICSGTIRIGRAESSVSKCSSMSCAVCSGRALLPLCCPCCAAAARAR